MPVELLEKLLEAREHRVEGGLVTGEVLAYKGLEDLAITVVSSPEVSDLGEAAPGTLALSLTMDSRELVLEGCNCLSHPGRSS
jgi:hypothetical protein